jgi:uncharacterized membrane protein
MMQLDNVIAIMAMTAVTYLTRITGILIGHRLPVDGRARRALDALPIAVLTAVIAPAVTSGPAEMIAGIATVLAVTRLPLIAAIALGSATVVVCRTVFGLS